MENTIRYKPELETVPQTGSTNYLAMETDIDGRNLNGFNYIWGGGKFSTGLYVNLTWRFLHAEVQDGERIPEVVIIWKRKTISTWSQGLRQCFWAFQVRLCSNRWRPTSENSVMCKLPVWGTVSTSDSYLMLFSEVGQCRYRWKWIPKTLPQPLRSLWSFSVAKF